MLLAEAGDTSFLVQQYAWDRQPTSGCRSQLHDLDAHAAVQVVLCFNLNTVGYGRRSSKGRMNMRGASVWVLSGSIPRARTPGVVALAHDLKTFIARLRSMLGNG